MKRNLILDKQSEENRVWMKNREMYWILFNREEYIGFYWKELNEVGSMSIRPNRQEWWKRMVGMLLAVRNWVKEDSMSMK